MPRIHALRGLRYDLGQVGALRNVVAPTEDIIDDEIRDELYKKHPANIVRLILNRDEPGDDNESNRFKRAAKFLKNWKQEGILQTESKAAVYVYHQIFNHENTEYTRRGFMCRTELEKFGEGTIFPEKETHASAKKDRLQLIRACKANLSPILGLYPDPSNAAQKLIEAAIEDLTPIEATDHLGVIHRIWPVTEINAISKLQALMGEKPTFVVDGHHLYETACNYRDELSAKEELPSDHPANSVLMVCVSMSDPGMIVLPTHRLFRGLRQITSDEIKDRLGDLFDCRIAGEGSDFAEMIWDEIEIEGNQGAIGLFTKKDERWLLAKINDKGRIKMSEIVADKSSDWQQLGVSILHQLIINVLMDQNGPVQPKYVQPKYVHQIDEVISSLGEGDVDGTEFRLAALVMPATLDHIRAISERGERMPAKSTCFFPKLLSGLVINQIE